METWPLEAPTWCEETLSLLTAKVAEKAPDSNVKIVMEKSNNFPIKFPVESVRCGHLLKKGVAGDILDRNINSTYPILHENALNLFARFILHKRKRGNEVKKEFFAGMTVVDLVERLLKKRAVMFVDECDEYLLITGEAGFGRWGAVSKDPGLMEARISYDEIKLSAFLSVSSYTVFINKGDRGNRGIPGEPKEEEGVVVGLVGPRLAKAGRMEFEELVVAPKHNSKELGYGDPGSIHGLFADFYQEKSFTYEEALRFSLEEPGRFVRIKDLGFLFDDVCYAKRISISIDTLLLEANDRAKKANKSAYVHLVGIGLGVWRISPHQEGVFVEAYAGRLKRLGPVLHSISDVNFSYFPNTTSCGGCESGAVFPVEGHPNGGIKILISKRDPSEKLIGDDDGKLLVVSYAWDGNALPGNEFWCGSLDSSSDPAAACSTQVAELHNAHINDNVCGSNLKVATLRDGLVDIKDYIKSIASKSE